MRTHFYTEADKDRAVRLVTEMGWCQAAAARQIGCSNAAVAVWMRKRGIVGPRAKRRVGLKVKSDAHRHREMAQTQTTGNAAEAKINNTASVIAPTTSTTQQNNVVQDIAIKVNTHKDSSLQKTTLCGTGRIEIKGLGGVTIHLKDTPLTTLAGMLCRFCNLQSALAEADR